MTPQEAVDAPRLHHQWLPDEILMERFALSSDTQALLQGYGLSDPGTETLGRCRADRSGTMASPFGQMQQHPIGCGRASIMVPAIRVAQPARRSAIRAPNWTVDGWRRGPLIRGALPVRFSVAARNPVAPQVGCVPTQREVPPMPDAWELTRRSNSAVGAYRTAYRRWSTLASVPPWP